MSDVMNASCESCDLSAFQASFTTLDRSCLSMLLRNPPKATVDLQIKVCEDDAAELLMPTRPLSLRTDAITTIFTQRHSFDIHIFNNPYSTVQASLQRELVALGWRTLRPPLAITVQWRHDDKACRQWTAKNHTTMLMRLGDLHFQGGDPIVIVREALQEERQEEEEAEDPETASVRRLLATMELVALQDTRWKGVEEDPYGKDVLVRLRMVPR